MLLSNCYQAQQSILRFCGSQHAQDAGLRAASSPIALVKDYNTSVLQQQSLACETISHKTSVMVENGITCEYGKIV